jgi:hypothetical protein
VVGFGKSEIEFGSWHRNLHQNNIKRDGTPDNYPYGSEKTAHAEYECERLNIKSSQDGPSFVSGQSWPLHALRC